VDNGIFNSAGVQAHLDLMEQEEIEFPSTGAHHQNAVAERNIRTVTEWACTICYCT
jgi:hypothetical protein